MSKKKKTVLLTGASRGIGKAIYEMLSVCGDYIILAPRRDEMDLSNADSIKAYMKKASKVDILINDAGINILKAIEDIDEASFAQMMEVNLQAPVKLIQSVVPYMKRQKYGRIVNISSIWGVRSKELRTLYSITKFALNGVTYALARELGGHNILVNSVCPGFTDTELTRTNIPAAERAEIKKDIPLGRFARPQEIAGLVKFLVSGENTYITGQTLIIDGGFLT